MRFHHLLLVLAFSALLAGLHITGLQEGLLLRLWWYDIMLHTLGGIVIASAYLWVVRFSPRLSFIPSPARFPHVFLFVFAVGVAWEVFEWLVGLYPTDIHATLHQLDTALDLAFDMGGATMAYMVFSRIMLPPRHG